MDQENVGTRLEMHDRDDWEVTVEIVDSGGLPVVCKQSALSVCLQQPVPAEAQNGSCWSKMRTASLELSVCACSDLLRLGRGVGMRMVARVGADQRSRRHSQNQTRKRRHQAGGSPTR